MLMPAACQVNRENMTVTAFGPPGQSAQRLLKAEVLQPLLERRRPRRVLLLRHALAADMTLESSWPMQVIRLGDGDGPADRPLRCSLAALPFEAGLFDLVVLLHLVGDGSEAVFDEALRVLLPGGELVVSGLNANGMRYRLGNRAERFPGIRMHKVIGRLKSRSFVVVRCLRAGLMGLSEPILPCDWHGLVLPCADHIVLHAHHHCGSTDGNVPRFQRVRATGATSVAFESCSNRVTAS